MSDQARPYLQGGQAASSASAPDHRLPPSDPHLPARATRTPSGAPQPGSLGPSSSASADTSAVRTEALLSIGQVVEQLAGEFPDLSITKVRYLEDRGLLTPLRTPGRYRKYSVADVRRLRTILTLQRDEYLPLEVIRQRVDRPVAVAPGQTIDPAAAALPTTPVLKPEEPLYTWDEAPEVAGVDDAFFRTLAEYRLLDHRVGQVGAVLSESDLEIARICQLLARFGVEPRNLRLLSSSAEREAALIEQVTLPSLRSSHSDKREYGERMLQDLGALLSRLLHLLLYKELRKLL